MTVLRKTGPPGAMPDLVYLLSMIFSENRFPLFRIML